MASSEKYEILQDDLENLMDKVVSSMDLSKKKKSPDEKRYWATRAEGDLTEMQHLLHEMEQEARAAPLQFRSEMLTTVRHFREKVADLNADLRRRHHTEGLQGLASSSSSLAHQPRPSSSSSYGAAARIMEQTSQSIERSQQVALESEAVSESIINDLNVQREALERTRHLLQDTGQELSRSQRILRKMSLVIIYNKVVLVAVIMVQLGIIAALIYWKWFSR